MHHTVLDILQNAREELFERDTSKADGACDGLSKVIKLLLTPEFAALGQKVVN